MIEVAVIAAIYAAVYFGSIFVLVYIQSRK